MARTEEGRLIEVALDAARAATAVHEKHRGTLGVEEWAEKSTANFVTRVDREAEGAVLERIRDAFPDHRVLAEEGTEGTDLDPDVTAPGLVDGWLWVVDPLDGTTNYIHGYPMYAASVAVLRDGQVLAGAVVAGHSGEEWTATKGGGAYMDGRRIHVSTRTALRTALIGTGFPFKALDRLPRYKEQLDRVLRNTSGIRRAGAAAVDLCHVASGSLDGFWEPVLAPWDVAAGALMIREAGGIITTMDADPDILARTSVSVLAGNPEIYRALARLLPSH